MERQSWEEEETKEYMSGFNPDAMNKIKETPDIRFIKMLLTKIIN